MSVFEHSRWRIFNPAQHPLVHEFDDLAFTNPRIPGATTLGDTLNYMIAVLFPKYVGTFADKTALEAYEDPQANDYAIVSDDGDGKMAGYVYTTIDGLAAWVKRYDVDWSMDSILAETVNKTQYMYYHKYGMSDRDENADVITGDLAGQHLYGGDLANQNLTLHANSGDTSGTRSGFVQVDDPFRPTVDDLLDLGTAAKRFHQLWLSDSLSVDTLVISSGSITDSSGAIDFGDEDLSTDGEVAAGTFVAGGKLEIGAGSIQDSDGAISFGSNNLSTTGNFSAAEVTATSKFIVGTLLLEAGSITDSSGAISFGDGDLTTTGDLSAVNGVFTSLLAGDLLLENNEISVTELDTNLILAANGSGVISLSSALETGDIDTDGDVAITGELAVGNLLLDENTLSATNTDGGMVFETNGAGTFSFNAALLPSANGTLSLGSAAATWDDVFLSGGLSDGTSSIDIDDLLSFRSAAYRDAGQTTPAEAGDTIFWDGTQWLASAPDMEINHPDINGLTTGDAGHTQFAMLAGRAGGQTILGGTEPGDDLSLGSTSDSTKGSVILVDPMIPGSNAAYSGGWSGIDLGDSSTYFRDVYTKGEFKGFRFHNTAPTSPSGQNVGRAVYSDGAIHVDTGAAFVETIMSAGDQTVGGEKTFSADAFFEGFVGIGEGPITPNVELDILGSIAIRRSNVASTATIASLATDTGYVKLTGTTATTVQGLASGYNGKRVIVQNGTNQTVTLKHQDNSATAADRVITPTGADLTILSNRAIELIYDSDQSRWTVASSGSGGGSYTTNALESIAGAGTITSTIYDGFQMRRVRGSGGAQTAATAPFGTAAGWFDGTVISLIGQDDDQPLTIVHSDTTDGCILNGDAQLFKNNVLTVQYDATASRWIELYRNF